MARLLTVKQKIATGEHVEAQRVLLFGASKSGKTELAGTLSATFNLLWLDLEDGKGTLLKSCTDEQLARIEYIKIPDEPETNRGLHTVLKLLDAFSKKQSGWICEEHGDWKCPRCTNKDADTRTVLDPAVMNAQNNWILVIDSATQYCLSALNNCLHTSGLKLEDNEKASFGIWAAQGAYIDKAFSLIQSGATGLHVLAIAHEMEVEMPDKSKKLVASIGTRRYASNFGKYFDHCIRTYKGPTGHKAISLTTSSPTVEAGSRWDLDISKDATLEDFFRLDVNKVKPGAPRPAGPQLGRFGKK